MYRLFIVWEVRTEKSFLSYKALKLDCAFFIYILYIIALIQVNYYTQKHVLRLVNWLLLAAFYIVVWIAPDQSYQPKTRVS